MTSDLVTAAHALLDDAVDLRRRIHRRPELGLHNPRTQEAVLEALDGLPLKITTGVSTSSVIAVIEGEQEGPTVLLRADTDALPMPEDTGLDYASEVDGAMHACGHDAHTAMLAGAARMLAERRGQLAGRVLLMFQPGEEGFHGARSMLEEGLLDAAGDRPIAAWAIHQSPTYPSGLLATRAGPIMAAADVIDARITGRGGHASMPHHACDPIPAAAEFISGVQAMVTRRVDVWDPAVVSITKIRAGTTNNVIPEEVLMAGTIRTFSERTRADVHAHLERLLTNVAAAHGGTGTLEITPGYPVTTNHDAEAATALAVGRALTGADDHVIEMPSPVMGAEDFSYVLQEVPGAMVFLGTRPPGVRGRDVAPNHSNRMVLDENAMAVGMAYYTALALETIGA